MKKEFYEEYFYLEKDYWFFVSRRKIAFSVLDKPLRHKKDLHILDVGTGTGVMTESLRKYGRVTGVDNSEEAINYCRKRGIFDIKQASAEKLPFENGTFDFVCAMDLLEHADSDKDVLKEFYRVLKPGGLMFVTVPAHRFLWTAHDEINLHKRRYSSYRLKTAIETSGFNIERFTYFNSILFPFVAGIKIVRRLCCGKTSSGAKSDFIVVPRLINRVLEAIFSSEMFLLKMVNLPYGISLMCLADKPGR